MVKNVGFTLIEILVVLVIISIVSASIAIKLGGNEKKQLQQFVEAMQESIANAQSVALLLNQGYQLQVSGQQLCWVEEKQRLAQPAYRLPCLILPSNMTVAESSQDSASLPLIKIDENGDLLPAALLLSTANYHKKLTVQSDGTINYAE